MVRFVSPGRIEIVGNHTDHNHGQVLVSSIDLATSASAEKTDDGIIRIKSRGYSEIVVDTGDTQLREVEIGQSQSVVRGIAEGFIKRGLAVGGFNAEMSSNVPMGAGVSSSASFELIIAEIFNVLYNNSSIDKITLAQIGQFAENVYMGKPCGLLDQAGIALGGVTHIDFYDPSQPVCETLSVEPFEGYKIIVTATGGDHADLTPDYTSIKEEMNQVAQYFGKEYLAEVDRQQFFAELPKLQFKVSGRAILRAAHFFDENIRVQNACTAIKRNNIRTFFASVKASGDSSFKLLQNCYSQGDMDQRIPLALYLSSTLIKKGAYRVHGGGFKGTILAFVHETESDVYIDKMSEVFGRENVIVTNFTPKGTHCLDICE